MVASLGVLGVALVLIAAVVIGWHLRIYEERTRINCYYPVLVSLCTPNTSLEESVRDELRLFGSTREYDAIRIVGDTPVAAGTAVVEYDVWGGEFTRNSAGEMAYERFGGFVGGSVVRQLRFMVPAGDGQAEVVVQDAWSSEGVRDEFAALTADGNRRLSAAPASATVEAALSFDHTMNLQELGEFMGDDVELMWAPVQVREFGGDVDEYLYGHMVGVNFTSGDLAINGMSREERESTALNSLGLIGTQAPSGTGEACRRSRTYLAEHGFNYYGAVVCGTPEQIEALAAKEGVSALCVGIILAPWE